MTKVSLLQGVWSPILTPVDNQLNPDAARLAEFGRYLLDNGCHGLVVFGTTSEATSFSVKERIALVDGLLEAGLPADKLVIGTGAAAITDTAELSAHATKAGTAGVMMLPPFYYKGMSDQGLFDAYAQIIQRVDDDRLKIYLYHIPPVSQVPLTLNLIEMLIAHFPDTVVGIKDSSGDWNNQKAMLERFPGFGIFTGSEKFLLDNLRLGGRGTICATANVIPAQIRDLFDNWQAPDADLRQSALMWMRDVLGGYAAIPALKALVAQRTGDAGWLRVRPPFVALTEAEQKTLYAKAEQALSPVG
jgi:4-hydroxy-tetrahydrodipicolinate synthase